MNGLRPIGFMGSSPVMGDTGTFLIDPTYATAIGNGDPVILSSGYVERATGAAEEVILGVLMGVKFADTAVMGGTRFMNHWDGTARASGLKVEATIGGLSPNTVFKISRTAAPAVSEIGSRFVITMGSVDTSLGFSGATLGATDADGPLKMLPLDYMPHPQDSATYGGSSVTHTALVVKALSEF